ncbi:MAG: hypothetical protein AAGF24_05540, partial [Cyanobacteria bacterium P01_H01_bin.121]
GGFDNETNQTVNQTNRTLGELDAALESFRIQNDGENFTIRVGSETLSLSSELVQAFLAIVTGETIGGTSPTSAITTVRTTLLNAGVPAAEVNALRTDLVGILFIGIDEDDDGEADDTQASLLTPPTELGQVQAIARLKATQLKAAQLKTTSLVNLEGVAQPQTLALDGKLLAQNEAALDQVRILSVDPVKLAESIDAFNAIILSSDRATLEAIKADAELMFIRDTLNLLAEAVVNREVAARTTPNDVTPIVGAASTPAPRTTRPDVAIAEPAPSPYSEGLEAAGAASQMAQRAASFTDWGQVAETWQTAIDLMQQVPANSPNHRAAQTSIVSYQRSLDYAKNQADPFYQAVTTATAAAELVQVASSAQDWQVVADKWQEAMELMKLVPTSYPRYDIAQNRVGVYQNNLEYAQQQAARAN